MRRHGPNLRKNFIVLRGRVEYAIAERVLQVVERVAGAAMPHPSHLAVAQGIDHGPRPSKAAVRQREVGTLRAVVVAQPEVLEHDRALCALLMLLLPDVDEETRLPVADSHGDCTGLFAGTPHDHAGWHERIVFMGDHFVLGHLGPLSPAKN